MVDIYAVANTINEELPDLIDRARLFPEERELLKTAVLRWKEITPDLDEIDGNEGAFTLYNRAFAHIITCLAANSFDA